jgi:hypothetical protein
MQQVRDAVTDVIDQFTRDGRISREEADEAMRRVHSYFDEARELVKGKDENTTKFKIDTKQAAASGLVKPYRDESQLPPHTHHSHHKKERQYAAVKAVDTRITLRANLADNKPLPIRDTFEEAHFGN